MRRWFIALTVCVAAVVAMGGCGGSKELAPPTPTTNENLSPEEIQKKMAEMMPASKKAEMEKHGMKMPGSTPAPAPGPAK